MWLLVNLTKRTNTLYLNQYLLTTGNLQISKRQLQNNSIKSAMLVTFNRVMKIF